MSQAFVGQIIAVGFNFAPVGWALCQGQLVSIAEYSVLYNLIGTTYGGDGVNTFALPDLRGRTAVHQGPGPSGSTYVIGQPGGTEQVTLTSSQIGGHNHSLFASSQTGSTNTPSGSVALANGAQPLVNIYGAAANTTVLAPSIGLAGGNGPHENRQPFLCINYIIALFGPYPTPS